jgi:hypothetical protein
VAAVAMPQQWEPSPRDLVRAEDDLEWLYNCCESELGAHGSGFEPGTIGWDDEAIMRLIANLFRRQRVEAVRRYHRVALTLRRLSVVNRERAGWIYEPRQYPVQLRIAWPNDRRSTGETTLAGAALRAGATLDAFARAHGGREASGFGETLQWADSATRPRVIEVREREAGRLVTRERLVNRSSLPQWASAALVEAREMRRALLEAYATARQAQWREVYAV